MNSARGFYKFLIFVIFIFVFLGLLPQRKFALAGCWIKDSWTSDIWYNYSCDCNEGLCDMGFTIFGCWLLEGYKVTEYRCDCPGPGACGGGCFGEGTEIEIKETEGTKETKETKEIENLEPGDIVSSFNPETGEISESQVAEVHKITREGYFELETESGKKVKVTGEHPFLAVKSEENLISKLKTALSNTLTFRLITSLQTKLIEILD